MGHLRLREGRLSGILSCFQTHSPDAADLGLNHYQKKRAPLDRKMERQSVCKWVCVKERRRQEWERHTRGDNGKIQTEMSRRRAGNNTDGG